MEDFLYIGGYFEIPVFKITIVNFNQLVACHVTVLTGLKKDFSHEVNDGYCPNWIQYDCGESDGYFTGTRHICLSVYGREAV